MSVYSEICSQYYLHDGLPINHACSEPRNADGVQHRSEMAIQQNNFFPVILRDNG